MAKKSKAAATNQIAVIGLGRFGSSLALELVDTDHEVLGIDSNESVVQSYSTQITQTVQADATSPEALAEIDIQNFERVVVAIGENIEASILTASLLLQMGVKQVWAKANSAAHGKILRQLGVHHVIFPEYEMGRRVAHMVTGESLDYVQIDEDFVMVKSVCPESFDGKDLAELKIRSTYHVTVVAVKKPEGDYKPAFPETVLNSGDHLVVAGGKKALDEFVQLQ